MAQAVDIRAAAQAAGFTGQLLRPDDEGYEQARSIWNGAIARRPAVIARCATSADVAAALRLAHDLDLEISVRGGGHNFAGFALTDGGLMVDLSPMNGVSVDAAGRRARCGGGATWAQLDAAAQEHGLAVPGGFISHTGIAGLTLGGGLGWLTRAHGLSIDNLVGVEMVAVDGRVVRASESEQPDLFWAVRGGGGNFGVVTEFEFALHPVGPMVTLALLFWPAEQAADALRVVRDVVGDLPDEIGILLAGLSLPPAPFVPEPLVGRTGFALLMTDFGAPQAHAAAVERAKRALAPLVEVVTPIPYVALQQMFDAGAPWGIQAYEKAVHLEELSDAVIDVLAAQLPKKASPLTFSPTFVTGGAMARVADDATAFSGRRSTRFVCNFAAIAPTPELLEADRAWVRETWERLVPHAAGAGSYVNFMSEYEEDRVRAAYGPDKYDRLARLKGEWDPENRLHLNANVRPAVLQQA